MASTKIYKVTGFDTVIINGVEITKYPSSLDACRWDQVAELIKTGNISEYFNIGDKKYITMSSGETIGMTLVSINDGTGEAGIFYPNKTADFVADRKLTSSIYYSNWGNNEYGGANWKNSNLRQYIAPKIYANLPSELKPYIIEKTHQYVNYYYDSSLSMPMQRSEICSDKIWLPTAAEWTNGTYKGATTYSGSNVTGETSAYNKGYNISSQIKNNLNGARVIASTYQLFSSASNIKYINANFNGSSISGNYTDNQSLPTTVCFRIG